MKYHLQVIGNKNGVDMYPSVMVHFDSGKYLFGAGEGLQRACIQSKVKLSKVGTVVTSRISSETVGGLPGFILSASEHFKALRVIGPRNLNHFLSSCKCFLYRPELKISTLELPFIGADFECARNTRKSVFGQELATTKKVASLPIPSWMKSVDLIDDGLLRIRPIHLYACSCSISSGLPSHQIKNGNSETVSETPRKRKSTCLGQESVPDLNLPTCNIEAEPLKVFTSFSAHQHHPLSEEAKSESHFQETPTHHVLGSKDHVIAYLCQGPDVPGKFDKAKALKLGVKQGKDFGLLSRGIPVVVEDGTKVMPETVLGKPRLGSAFLILDIPSADYIPSLVQNEIWKSTSDVDGGEPSVFSHVACIVHSLGKGVMESEEYQSWMSLFAPTTKHIVNCEEYLPASITYHSSADLVEKLSAFDPHIFPAYSLGNEKRGDPRPFPNLPCCDMVEARSLICYQFEPVPLLYYADSSSSVSADKTSSDLLMTESTGRVSDISIQEELLLKLQKEIQEQLNETIPLESEYLDLTVVPLGTGSSAPGLYRNVSSTLVQFPSCNVLLDVGEGTLGQLFRHFGASKVESVISGLKIIYISHMHADHHLGFFSLMREWTRLRRPDQCLYVLAPHSFRHWISCYAECESFGLEHIIFIDNYEFFAGSDMASTEEYARHNNRSSSMASSCPPMDNKKTPYINTAPAVVDDFLLYCNISYLKTVHVHHCAYSYAITIEIDEIRISFSGDCRPSPSFVRIGQNSHLLIHEATMNDDLPEEARMKRHSTISEAIQMGVDMKANYTLLTHFSQRYPKIANIAPQPRLRQSLENREIDKTRLPIVGVAFDLMRITLKDFWKLPAFIGPIQMLFQDHEAETSEPTSKSVSDDSLHK